MTSSDNSPGPTHRRLADLVASLVRMGRAAVTVAGVWLSRLALATDLARQAVAGSMATLAARSNGGFWPGLVVVVLSVISGLATFLILTNLTPLAPRNDVVMGVLLINGLLIVAMLAVVAWQVRELVRAWQRKVPGARLHVRIVLLFSLIAALPAILLAAAASTTFSRSLDNWFTSRTRGIIESSLAVAQAYVEEHGGVIRTEIVSMARDLDSAAPATRADPKKLRGLIIVQAGLRNLPAAFLIDSAGEATTSVILDDKITFTPPPPEVIAQALAGQPVLMHSPETARIGAVTRLQTMPDQLLYVVRGISPQVVNYITKARVNMDEYERLRKGRSGLTAAHSIMYSTISLTALLAAIWCGLWFAGRFVAPIQRLILAAQQVSRGNLDVALPEKRGEGDMRRLSQTFNRMTADLKTQRQSLMAANTQLSERRAFMEAVLTGVSAGVIGLDPSGVVTLANRSAERLLQRSANDLVGKRLDEVLPTFGEVLKARDRAPAKAKPQDEIVLTVAGEDRTFAVGLTAQDGIGPEAGGRGAILTFDDITELVSAQRTSAWADVARRIAHEIKNPLTPIQLSAERIRRKYDRVIVEDRDVFIKCTDTIIRNVGDVARMVDEFSSFARMPEPQMENYNVVAAVQESVTLHQMGQTSAAGETPGAGGIEFTLAAPAGPVMLSIDRRMISQVMTNLIKNGAESIQSVIDADAKDGVKDPGYKGRVETIVRDEGGRVVIEVIDNGTGLQKQNRSRLLEPYVTTKVKGTGLGLAIVKKVVEQHGGQLSLDDAPQAAGRTRGAMVRIVLPRPAKAEVDRSQTTERMDTRPPTPTRTAAE